jgi:hypothetical protein
VSEKNNCYGLKDENSLRLLTVVELYGGVEFDLISFCLMTRQDAIVTFNSIFSERVTIAQNGSETGSACFMRSVWSSTRMRWRWKIAAIRRFGGGWWRFVSLPPTRSNLSKVWHRSKGLHRTAVDEYHTLSPSLSLHPSLSGTLRHYLCSNTSYCIPVIYCLSCCVTLLSIDEQPRQHPRKAYA